MYAIYKWATAYARESGSGDYRLLRAACQEQSEGNGGWSGDFAATGLPAVDGAGLGHMQGLGHLVACEAKGEADLFEFFGCHEAG